MTVDRVQSLPAVRYAALVACMLSLVDADVARAESAPPPGAESGRVDEPHDSETPMRAAGRVVLAVPRTVFELAMQPIRWGLMANERYRVIPRLRRFFVSESGDLGVFPVLRYDTSLGFLGGAQMQARLTPDDHLAAFAGIGAARRRFSSSYRATNRLDGHLALGGVAEYDLRPEGRFYGVGNGDVVESSAMPIDATAGGVAAETFYNDRLARVAAIADVDVGHAAHVAIGGALSDRRREVSDRGRAIIDVFMPSSLVAFDGYRAAYGELELRLDTRAAGQPWLPRDVHTHGSLLLVYGGRATLDPGSGYWRYGLDAQQFLYLGSGPRVLFARLRADAVTAGRDEVPFTELPVIGGATTLRGYHSDRFRDRIAAVGSLEYQWDLARYLYASLFVDVGRVYGGLDELSLGGLRAGYGVAFEAHTDNTFVTRVSIASSVDGGAFFNLYFHPVSNLYPRVRRR